MNDFWNQFRNVTDHVNANSDLAEIESQLFSEIEHLKTLRTNTKALKRLIEKSDTWPTEI